MKKTFEEIFNIAKNESLKESERELLRARILSFVKQNPLQTPTTSRPVFSMYSFELFSQRHTALLFAVFVFFVTGTTSVFAERALPGDVFYPIKTGVNEKVLSLFVSSGEARAEWELNLADRRLGEIEELSKEQRITPEVRSDLESKIDLHTALALGTSTDTLVGNEETIVIADDPTDTSIAAMSTMSASAEVTPVPPGMALKKAAAPIPDSVSLRETIATHRKSITDQKTELKKQNLFVKRKAAVLVAEKLSLQADDARARGDSEEAGRFEVKAQNILSHITPLSTESELISPTPVDTGKPLESEVSSEKPDPEEISPEEVILNVDIP